MSEKRDNTENDATLPFSALRLLAPPMRLVSAAMWKVVKQRDVMQYGIVEEMVTSACETVPGLLTYRHQGKLTLGLRARLILELCRGGDNPDPKVIIPHLERIRAPAALTSSSAYQKKRDVKIEKTVSTFHEFVQTLLRNPDEREHFFKDTFPVDYGPHFDQALEKLLWEFLIRLDQLLPVPNLAQTVSWISAAPPVLEECARAATQPQLLSVLLQHEACLGHLETAASLPQNMGDCILTSLSLPPSGRVASNQKMQHMASSTSDTVSSSPVSETHHKTPFITPVIGLICNKDVPAMMASKSNKTKSRDDESARSQHVTNKECKQKGSSRFTVVRQKEKSGDSRVGGDDDEEAERGPRKGINGAKRKQPHISESDSEEEEVVGRATRSSRRKLMKRSARKGVPRQNAKENEDQCVKSGGEQESSRERLRNHMLQRGLETLKLPQHPSLYRIVSSCLLASPKVLLRRSSVTIVSQNSEAEKTVVGQPQGGRRKSTVTVRTQANQGSDTRTPELELTDFGDKENHPVSPVISSPPSLHHRNTDAEDDVIVDSEDEATKNFKDRLFVKRYFKTKHDTYVPTLREFWTPLNRRNWSSSTHRRSQR